MHIRTFAIAVGSIALTAGPVYGQSDAPSGTTANATSASADSSELAEVVVTARRAVERLQDVPISVTVQTGQQLEAAGVIDTRGLELVSPGLTMMQQDGFLEPALRGVSTEIVGPGAENPIAIYLDGVYVSSLAGSIISLPDVDRVEVDKGPQGTLFGRNATGGAIQIFTKDPSFTPTGSISLIGGYYDGGGESLGAYDLGVRGFVSGPVIPDLLAASVSFSQEKSNGYDRNIVVGQVSPAVDAAYGTNRLGTNDDELLRGKLLFTPSDDLKVLATAYWTHRNSEQSIAGYVVDGQSTAIAFSDHITASRPWEASFDYPTPDAITQTYGSSVKVDWKTEIGTFTSTSAYSRATDTEGVDTDSSYSPGCLATYACIGVRDEFVDIDVQQELLFSSRKFGHFDFVSGVFAYRSSSYLDVGVDECSLGCQPGAGQVVLQPVLEYNETIISHAYGVFAEGNYDLTDQLTATVGARESYESKLGTIQLPTNTPSVLVANPDWNAFTPRASLRYALDSASNVYGTFSKGFKSGVIADGSATAKPASPEKLTSYEVGFKTAQPWYAFNAAAFYYDYKDLQVQSNAGLGGALTVVNNAASAEIYGLDVDGTMKITHDLSIHAGVSWIPFANFISYPDAVAVVPVGIAGYAAGTTVVNLSGTRLYKTPKITSDLGMTYATNLGGGEFSFTPNVYYASDQYFDATHLYHPDDLRIGLETAYKPQGSSFKYAFWVKNLNNAHAPVQYSFNNNSWTVSPEPPREIGLTMTFDF